MNSLPPSDLALRPVKNRKTSTAMNLSLFLPGLGQIYCGDLRRGLLQLSFVSALLAGAIVFLAMEGSSPSTVLIAVAILTLIPMIYSAWDARRMALATREDYRLKDYNRLSVYLALTFLMSCLTVGVAFSIRENFLHVFKMAGNSMSPTLEDGWKILVRKDAYLDRGPDQNELVAFLNPENRRQTWVKRVIGLPGDTLEIRKGTVFINEEPLEEVAEVALDHTDLGPITIPNYHCYLLGDNRAKSRDSRHIGPVPMIALVGKVIFTK